jgi:hypothetical protein
MPPCRSTVATGEAFRLWKASLRLLCILRTLVPRCRWAQVSEVSPCMSTKTSAASAFTQKRAADSRLPYESDEGRSDERWAPTRTTGRGRSPSMKERAAAVYPRVSVPWGTMTPSTPELSSSATESASSLQVCTFMFSLNMEKTTLDRMRHISDSSGTVPTSSSAFRAGCTAPVR